MRQERKVCLMLYARARRTWAAYRRDDHAPFWRTEAEKWEWAARDFRQWIQTGPGGRSRPTPKET